MPSIVSESIRNGINEIVNRCPGLLSSKILYMLEEIPAEKLNNAIASYIGQLANDETVLFLSNFGSGEDGFVITTKCIYWKDHKLEVGYVQIKNILDIKEGKRVLIVFNTDNGAVEFNPFNGLTFDKFYMFLSDIVTFLKAQKPNANADASTTTGQAAIIGICKSCGAPKTGGGSCEYCGTMQ